MNYIDISFWAKADQIIDFIPVVSLFTNTAHIFYKCIILPDNLEALGQEKSSYEHYIQNKSILKCLLSATPIIGTIVNIAIAIFNSLNSEKSNDPTNTQNLTNRAPPVATAVPPSTNQCKYICDYSAEVTSQIMSHEDIPLSYTTVTSIETQQENHAAAKQYLSEYLCANDIQFIRTNGINVDFPELQNLDVQTKSSSQPLNPTVFSFQYTNGVRTDITRQLSKKENNTVHIYGVASQYNGGEAPDRYTISLGQASNTYEYDRTQGPQAQLAFGPAAVETINCAANIGFNGLMDALDAETIRQLQDGYFTPIQPLFEKTIAQLKQGTIEYPCFGFIKDQGSSTVYEILVSSPAFGRYQTNKRNERLELENQNQIELLCFYHSIQAQFEAAIAVAKKTKKAVILNAAATGLGVFGNQSKNYAKAFYFLGKKYEQQLSKEGIKVYFQVYRDYIIPDLNAAKVAELLSIKEVQQSQ